MNVLREGIIKCMQDPKWACCGWYPTWRFKFRLIQYDTPAIRSELNRMEKDGIVVSDRSQSNNTMWQLVVPAPTP